MNARRFPKIRKPTRSAALRAAAQALRQQAHALAFEANSYGLYGHEPYRPVWVRRETLLAQAALLEQMAKGK